LGFDVFARLACLEQRIERADLVITGEGSVDASSLMGKGVGQVLGLAARHDKPVIVLGGRIALRRRAPAGVLAMEALTDIAGLSEAMRSPAAVTRDLATRAAKGIAARLPEIER
jgi:glycerate kinase